MGEDEPHRIRVTTGGKVAAYVRAALAVLEKHPSRPVILHTEPRDDDETKSVAKSSLHPSTLAAPRLISVVEDVKRQYVDALKPGPEPRGIWQYTETGLLPSPEAERPSLERVLSGRTKPKMTHRPYLRITLSTRPLGLERGRNVTCQVTLKSRRRGSRGRKKGKKKGEDPDSAQEESEEGSAEGSEEAGEDDTPDEGIPMPRPAPKRKSDAAPTPATKRVRTTA